MHALAAQRAAVPPHFFGISVAASCVFLALALLMKWKTFNKISFLIPWFMLIAGVGFSAAFLHKWAHGLSGFGASVIPVVGVAVPIVVAVVLLWIVVYDFWPGHPSNTMTEASALLLPAFAPEIGGAIGGFLASILSSIAIAGAHGIGALFGV